MASNKKRVAAGVLGIVISPITGLNANPFTNADGTYNFSCSYDYFGSYVGAFNTAAVSYTGTNSYTWVPLGYPNTGYTTVVNGSNVTGNWIQIKLPFNASITQYAFSCANSRNNNISQITSYSLVGSNDGTTWSMIDGRTIAPSYALQKFSCSAIPYYNYIRFIVKTINGDDVLWFQTLQLKGLKQ